MNGSRKAWRKFGDLVVVIIEIPITGFLLTLAIAFVGYIIPPIGDFISSLGMLETLILFIGCCVITGTVLLKQLSDDRKSDAKARARAILEKESPSMDFVLDPKTENKGIEKITERANQILTKWSVLNTSNINEVVSRYQKCYTSEMDLQKQINSFEAGIAEISDNLK